MMIHLCTEKLLILLYILTILPSSLTLSHGDNFESKVLNDGEELWKETLPLRMGSRLYQLQGLKIIKLIPTSSLQLKKGKGNLDLGLNRNRRLLNTEKLIFKTVCNELLLGIPCYACWVVVWVLMCLGLALIIPYFLGSCLLPKNRRSSEMQTSKES